MKKQEYKPETTRENIEREMKKASPKTVEEFAQKLLDMGFTEDMLKKITPNHVLQAQKILLEKQKVKNQTNAQQIALLKFMSGMTNAPFIEEGETIEELPEGSGGENNAE